MCSKGTVSTFSGLWIAKASTVLLPVPLIDYGLRDYGAPGQLGLENSPEQYIETMVAVFREVRRVLRRDGTLWLNIGDSYAGSGRGPMTDASTLPRENRRRKAMMWEQDNIPRGIVWPGLKPKDLIGIPWMLAFALRADGWYLRSDIIWSKPNPMPESVTDRPTKAHEYLFLLTKSSRYFYDADAIREDSTDTDPRRANGWSSKEWMRAEWMQKRSTVNNNNGVGARSDELQHGRNKRSVWEIATEAFPAAHFATFPTALVEPCIKAGTSERGCCPECGDPWVRVVEIEQVLLSRGGYGRIGDGRRDPDKRTDLPVDRTRRVDRTLGWRPSCTHADLEPQPATVLDPFSGAGTTLLVADRLNRHGIGIELSPAYADMARARIAGDNPMFVEVENPPAVPVRWDASTHTIKESPPPIVLDGQLDLFSPTPPPPLPLPIEEPAA